VGTGSRTHPSLHVDARASSRTYITFYMDARLLYLVKILYQKRPSSLAVYFVAHLINSLLQVGLNLKHLIFSIHSTHFLHVLTKRH